ncbi:hypothetical protein D3C73_1406560 [compost metagenome]
MDALEVLPVDAILTDIGVADGQSLQRDIRNRSGSRAAGKPDGLSRERGRYASIQLSGIMRIIINRAGAPIQEKFTRLIEQLQRPLHEITGPRTDDISYRLG